METLAPIRELFDDPDLRAQLSEVRSEDEALGLVVAAGAEKDVSFSADSIKRLIDVLGSPQRTTPTDQELADVSGHMRGTHGHMSCCTECPSGSGLCK
jgi:hypothetical protein